MGLRVLTDAVMPVTVVFVQLLTVNLRREGLMSTPSTDPTREIAMAGASSLHDPYVKEVVAWYLVDRTSANELVAGDRAIAATLRTCDGLDTATGAGG